MSRLPLAYTPTLSWSKIDRVGQARATFRAAHSMARCMVRPRPGRSTGEALTWYLDHGFKRFGYAALPIVRAAGWAVFDRLHVTKAATGTAEELARQGMLTRCVRLERAPHGGWSWAWTHDPLAAANLNRGRRVQLARQRRAVALAMAADRLAMADCRFAITPAGRAALQAAMA